MAFIIAADGPQRNWTEWVGAAGCRGIGKILVDCFAYIWYTIDGREV